MDLNTIPHKFPSKKIKIYSFLLISIWVIYYFYIVLQTGFISDDAYNSQVKGNIIQNGETVFEHMFSSAWQWLKNSGRLMPLSVFSTIFLYHTTQDPVIVKTITILIMMGGIALYFIHSTQQTKSNNIGLLAAISLPVFIQFRSWHDPVLGFTFLMPLIFLLFIASLVYFEKYILYGDRYKYYLSVFFYFLSVITYELSVPLCIIFFATAVVRSKDLKMAIHESLPYALISILVILTSAYFKNSSDVNAYPGANLHLNPLDFFQSLLIQISSSFPLSYDLFSGQHLNTILFKMDYPVLLFFVFIFGFASLNIKKEGVINLKSWVVSGFLLLILPAALTSLSGHQRELIDIGFGYGYLPVYLQYFGLATLFISLYVTILRRLNGKFLLLYILLFSLLFGFIAGKNLGLNRFVALKTNDFYLYPRDLLGQSLQAGILTEAPNHSTIFRLGRYPSDHSWFYTTSTGKIFQLCDLAYDENELQSCLDKIKLEASANENFSGLTHLKTSNLNIWALAYFMDRNKKNGGAVFSGKINSILLSNSSRRILSLNFSQVTEYNSINKEIVSRKLNHDFNFLDLINNQNADYKTLDANLFGQVQKEEVDLFTEWTGKVHEQEGTATENVRWLSGNSNLIIYNISGHTVIKKLSFKASSTGSKPASLLISGLGNNIKIQLSNTSNLYTKDLSIPPGKHEVKFITDAEPINNGDPRKIALGIYNFTLTNKTNLQ